MKENLVKLAAVAAVAMFAQVAGAQSFVGRMKAEVPFTFQAGKATLAPGTYEVTMANSIGGSTILKIGNMETMTFTHFTSPAPYRKDVPDVAPSVVFTCKGETCLLQSVRVVNKEYGTGAKHKLTAAEKERTYTINLTPASGRRAE